MSMPPLLGRLPEENPALNCLAKVLSNPLFARAGRQSRFLDYVVRRSLEEDWGALKESQIGLVVYERNANYDPRYDPIVRVEASRLRARLREYYEEEGQDDQIRFVLPKGSYAVQFASTRPEAASIPAPEPEIPETVTTPAKPRRPLLQHGGLVLVACALVLAAWLLLRPKVPANLTNGPITSLAVLPFVDLSEKADQKYLAAGLTEDLTSELTKIYGLQVAGGISASRVNPDAEPREIAERLHVKGLLRGNVRRSSDAVRVSVQLVDGRTGFNVWSTTLERPIGDLFSLQDDLRRAIAQRLEVHLVARTEDENLRHSPQRMEAYQLFLRARQIHRQMNPATLNEARLLHEEAVAKDPTFPLGHSGLAHLYITLASEGVVPRGEVRDRAEVEARKAIALDPTLADGHSALIRLYRDLDFNWKAAEQECTQARGKVNGSSTVAANCAILFGFMNRMDEAEKLFHDVRVMEPLWSSLQDAEASALLRVGRLDEAMAVTRDVLRQDPSFYPSHLTLAAIEWAKGQHQEALAHAEARIKTIANPSYIEWYQLGYMYASLGQHEKAAEIARRGARWPLVQAAIAVAYGKKKEAIANLRLAFERRDPGAAFSLIEREFRPLIGDPEFEALRRQAGITWID